MLFLLLQSLLRWADVIDTIKLIAAGRHTTVQHKRSDIFKLSPKKIIPAATMIDSKRRVDQAIP